MIPAAYKAAVGAWGIQPSEFWGMQPWEFWQLADFHRVPPDYGSMSETEVERIYRETYGDGEEEDED